MLSIFFNCLSIYILFTFVFEYYILFRNRSFHGFIKSVRISLLRDIDITQWIDSMCITKSQILWNPNNATHTRNYIYFTIFWGERLWLGVSTSQSGSGLGLCPIRNWPAYIGWTTEWPAADCRQPWVELDRTPVDNGRVSWPCTELQSPNFRLI